MEKWKERLERVFQENFERHGEIGASVSVCRNGEEVFSLSGGMMVARSGEQWTDKTMVPVFSATKGPASACVLAALESSGLSPENEVGEVWPEFPLPFASIAQLLSHQCGMAALDVKVPIEDHEAVVEAIVRQKPAWLPPRHGYHPRMFGPLVEELVRRLTGKTLGQYWESRFRIPLGIEFWIGLPESEFPRVARLYPGRATPQELQAPFYKEYLTEGTLIKRAFQSPMGYFGVHEMNREDAWTGAFPALGGVATASALSAFYQACLGTPLQGGVEVVSPEMRKWMQAMQTNGRDEILWTETAFSCGFMMDPVNEKGEKIRHLFGPHLNSFGHPGAGGSIGLADPETGFSFAYTMNQMELGVLPGVKTSSLLEAFFGGE